MKWWHCKIKNGTTPAIIFSSEKVMLLKGKKISFCAGKPQAKTVIENVADCGLNSLFYENMLINK